MIAARYGAGCLLRLISTRYIEDEVITIREAAWLTDNTYFYEQVVRTMGQALFATGGALRQPTHLDFVRLYASLARVLYLHARIPSNCW